MSIVFPSVSISEELYGGGTTSRRSVRVATTTNAALSTSYESGDTIDGIILNQGDRILIKNQTNGVENGIYIVNLTGSPSRTIDYDEGSNVASTMILVREGNTNAESVWMCSNDFPNDEVGSDVLNFMLIAGGSSTTTSGTVFGPPTTTTNAIPRFDGTSGKVINASSVQIDNTNNITGVNNITANGSLTVSSISLNGTPLIYGTEFEFAVRTTNFNRTQNTFGTALTLNTAVKPIGTYRIDWYYEWAYDSVSDDFVSRIQLDGSIDLAFHKQEPKDNASTPGLGTPATGGGITGSGTDQIHQNCGFTFISFGTATTHSITVGIASSNNVTVASVKNVRLSIFRVS